MRMLDIVGKILPFFAKIAPWVVFVGLAVAMLFDPGRDTLSVASASFAVALALAAVTFSYARTLKEGTAARDELVFAGERLISGAVLFLVASILKHASYDVPRYVDVLFWVIPRGDAPPPDVTIFGMNGLGLLIALSAFIFFLSGVIYAQMGMVILVGTANHRSKRRIGHDDYFVSGKAVEQRLSGLDRTDRGAADAGNGVAAGDGPTP